MGHVEEYTLFIHAQNLHTLEVSGHETVAHLKVQIKSLEDMTLEDQVIFLSGISLENVQLFENDSVIGQCGISVKIHSSLAHAVKVKGQTPKVLKQEKKKKTEWGKRLMQYNCQFINIVPSFGKKRGPNANS
ncbi:ubiquitin-like FUBI-ribosomal protein eS30 fusion protein [Ahaetulla prasina]|uniref:ubiquitin-like FUBI-ribosomal protein eS30 fusion protein n=1 Tax=Ahaetulla prasina TaxID=499056 RepID=UPI0026484E6F|nr:ubiquitin-like FUBI-ribosomal protein eS30 fusion protein [Ahaetulla prasina]